MHCQAPQLIGTKMPENPSSPGDFSDAPSFIGASPIDLKSLAGQTAGSSKSSQFLLWCKNNGVAVIATLLVTLFGITITLLIALFNNSTANVNSRFNTVHEDLRGVQDEFDAVRSEMGNEFRSVRTEIQGVRGDINQLHRDVGELRGKVAASDNQAPNIASNQEHD